MTADTAALAAELAALIERLVDAKVSARLANLEQPDRGVSLTEDERQQVARAGVHGLTTALETIRRLARSQESALGQRLAG